MFIVRKKLPGAYRFAIMICRSVREGSKIRQKVVQYFGIVHNEKDLKALNKVAEIELRKLKKARVPTSPPLETMHEEARILDGFHDIFGVFFDRLKLNIGLSKLRYRQLRDVVIARIIEPVSKAHTSRFLRRSRLQQLSEDQIYRLMDDIANKETDIKANIFNAITNVIQDHWSLD